MEDSLQLSDTCLFRREESRGKSKIDSEIIVLDEVINKFWVGHMDILEWKEN